MSLRDEVKKFLGKSPYDKPSNTSRGDGYFRLSLNDKYGKQNVDEEIRRASCHHSTE